MTATCALCGAPLTPQARFCASCGTPVAPAAGVSAPTSPYEGGGGYEEYYPEDFPDRLPADAGRPVMAGASYPTEPPSAYGPAAYGPAYGPPQYGPVGGETYPDENVYATSGFTDRNEGLASPWQESGGERPRALLIGAAALLGLLVLIGLVYFLLFRPSSSPTAALPSASSAPSAPGAVTSPPVAGSTPPAVRTPPSPSKPAYPAVALPAGSTLCPTVTTGAYARAAAGNSSTSCEFATAVRAAYVPPAAPGTSVPVRATSPRTGKTYTMTCSGDQPVTCGGGNNALVFLFGGTPSGG